MQAWEMTRSAGCMHLSVGAGLLANAVVLLWACLLDADRSHASRSNAALDAPRHLDDADAGLGNDAERRGMHAHAERGNAQYRADAIL
jgi:hypothetical protein